MGRDGTDNEGDNDRREAVTKMGSLGEVRVMNLSAGKQQVFGERTTKSALSNAMA